MHWLITPPCPWTSKHMHPTHLLSTSPPNPLSTHFPYKLLVSPPRLSPQLCLPGAQPQTPGMSTPPSLQVHSVSTSPGLFSKSTQVPPWPSTAPTTHTAPAIMASGPLHLLLLLTQRSLPRIPSPALLCRTSNSVLCSSVLRVAKTLN